MKQLLHSQAIYLEEITTDWAMESIQPQWWMLWRNCGRAGPFQSPAWICNWWKHFSPGTLLVLAIHYDSKLAGLAPFYIETNGSCKTLKFIGTGMTDYNDILAHDLYEEDVVGIIYEYLITHQRLWDKCDLSAISPNSTLVESLSDYIEVSFAAMDCCPFIDLSLGRASVLGYIDSVHRKKIFKSLRMIQPLGSVRLEKALPVDVPGLMTDLFGLQKAGRAMRNLGHGMRDEKGCVFHMDAAKELADHDLLGLFRLKVADRMVAVIYGFIVRDVFYSYLVGFEPAFAKYRPDNLAIFYLMEYCMNTGIKTFDLLSGDEKYKFLWGAQNRRNYRLVIEPAI